MPLLGHFAGSEWLFRHGGGSPFPDGVWERRARGRQARNSGIVVGQAGLPHSTSGPWTVRFAPGWGAPGQATFEKLVSWSIHADPGIKYYSGTAVYSAAFELPRTLLKGDRRLYLDLGRVEVMADVKVNGKRFPLLWKPPYRLDVTTMARPGQNTIEITVVNLWPNRLIGDEQLPEDSERNPDGTLKRWPPWLLAGKPSPTGRYTFTSWRLWKKSDLPLESGLLGPVKLIPAHEFEFRN